MVIPSLPFFLPLISLFPPPLLSLSLEEGLPNPAKDSEEHCNLPQHGPMVNTPVCTVGHPAVAHSGK